MINQAIILADMHDRTNPKKKKCVALKKMLGLTFINRALHTLHSNGVKNIVVVLGADAEEVKKSIEQDKNIIAKGIKVNFTFNNNFENRTDSESLLTAIDEVKGNFLCFRVDEIFHPKMLKEIFSTYESDQNLICVFPYVSALDRSFIRVKSDIKNRNISAIGESLDSFNYFASGLFIFNKDSLKINKDTKFSLYDLAGELAKEKNLTHLNIEDWFSYSINSKIEYFLAEKDLQNSVRKPTDGIISRNLNRYISLFMSKYFLKLNATPNVITAITLVVGLASAFYISRGGYFYSLIGALLFQLASIMDGCDGEVAKLTYRSTKFGEWFDTTCDNATYVAFLFGLPIGLFRYHQTYLYLILGFLTFVAVVGLVYQMIKFVKQAEAGGSMVKIVKDIEAEAVFDPKDFNKTMNYVISKIAFMLRRDFFAFAFLAICLVGFSFVIQWAAAIALIAANIYLFYYTKKKFPIQVPLRA